MPRSWGWVKPFNDIGKKEEMLNLRMTGYSYSQLSRRYRVHHSTIMYHCKKYKIVPGTGERIKIKLPKNWVLKENVPSGPITEIDSHGVEWIRDNNGRRICVGKIVESVKNGAETKKKKELELKRLQMLKY